MITRFLTLNRSEAAAAPAHDSTPARRILLVDDDDGIRDVCFEALVHSGYQVDVAANGQAGWEALQASTYDLLITDHDMPIMTGLELVKKVCASGNRLAIIIASGTFSPGELKQHPAIQISAALPKPFSPDDLVKTVQLALNGKESTLSRATF